MSDTLSDRTSQTREDKAAYVILLALFTITKDLEDFRRGLERDNGLNMGVTGIVS